MISGLVGSIGVIVVVVIAVVLVVVGIVIYRKRSRWDETWLIFQYFLHNKFTPKFKFIEVASIFFSTL